MQMAILETTSVVVVEVDYFLPEDEFMESYEIKFLCVILQLATFWVLCGFRAMPPNLWLDWNTYYGQAHFNGSIERRARLDLKIADNMHWGSLHTCLAASKPDYFQS